MRREVPSTSKRRYDGDVSVDLQSIRVRRFPDPILRTPTKRIGEITDEIRAVAGRMIALMQTEEGIGLAAPQVGLSWRMFVVHVPEGERRSPDETPATATRGPIVCVNPEVKFEKSPLLAASEGCLSLPEILCEVYRPSVVTMTAMNLDGETFGITAGGLLARCIQHEMDHLDGVLIIDKMTMKSQLANKAAIRRMVQTGVPTP